MIWQPSASIQILQQRAEILSKIRSFFSSRSICEVQTPLLGKSSLHAVNIFPFITNFDNGPQRNPTPLYLQTSPESFMKRLLAAGSGPIYQMSSVFRNGEVGRKHQPEFTMLEWYRPSFTLQDLIGEVSALLTYILNTPFIKTYTYQEVFQTILKINPHSATIPELINCAISHQFITTSKDLTLDKDGWLDLLMTHGVEAQLDQLHVGPIAITDYPASQAALAKIVNRNGYLVGERFEVYYQGLELANGYNELLDANEQRSRLEQDNQQRIQLGIAPVPLDEPFLAALQSGIPICSGVALGVDRLIMLALNLKDISQTVAFEFTLD